MKILRFIPVLSIGTICCSLLFLSSEAKAHKGIDFIGVYNTNDGGPGSLRNAILRANDDEDTQIVFQIPSNDKGYDPKTGIITIEPLSPLPVVRVKGTIFDGLAQTLINDSNKKGPEIRISGRKISRPLGSAPTPGLVLNAPECQVKGLIISDFAGIGLALRGEETIECRVQSNVFERNKGTDVLLQNGASGNWIGIAPDATPFNKEFNGIYSDNMGNEFYTDKTEAIRITGDLTKGNSIRGNRFYGTQIPVVFNPKPIINAPILKIERAKDGPVRHEVTVTFNGKPNQPLIVDWYHSTEETLFALHSKQKMTTHEVKADANGLAVFKTAVNGYPVGSHAATVTTPEGQTSEFSNVVVLPYLR
jgi:hypothetical protein